MSGNKRPRDSPAAAPAAPLLPPEGDVHLVCVCGEAVSAPREALVSASPVLANAMSGWRGTTLHSPWCIYPKSAVATFVRIVSEPFMGAPDLFRLVGSSPSVLRLLHMLQCDGVLNRLLAGVPASAQPCLPDSTVAHLMNEAHEFSWQEMLEACRERLRYPADSEAITSLDRELLRAWVDERVACSRPAKVRFSFGASSHGHLFMLEACSQPEYVAALGCVWKLEMSVRERRNDKPRFQMLVTRVNLEPIDVEIQLESNEGESRSWPCDFDRFGHFFEFTIPPSMVPPYFDFDRNWSEFTMSISFKRV